MFGSFRDHVRWCGQKWERTDRKLDKIEQKVEAFQVTVMQTVKDMHAINSAKIDELSKELNKLPWKMLGLAGILIGVMATVMWALVKQKMGL